MIAAFEQRLAAVRGARLPPPFRGNVAVAPAPAPSVDPAVVVGVERADSVDPDFNSRRPEIAPGVADPRRILRMNCTVGVRVQPANNAGRRQQMEGIDAALFELEAPDLLDGTALRGAGDPGFLIQKMRPVAAVVPIDSAAPSAPPIAVTLLAEGWFWPAGTPGQAGRTITEVRLRGATL